LVVSNGRQALANELRAHANAGVGDLDRGVAAIAGEAHGHTTAVHRRVDAF
jgi:hypothetical protein